MNISNIGCQLLQIPSFLHEKQESSSEFQRLLLLVVAVLPLNVQALTECRINLMNKLTLTGLATVEAK